ncbi:MAG: hypothetical protein Q9171_007183 [Xanthocarpia ochracea]
MQSPPENGRPPNVVRLCGSILELIEQYTNTHEAPSEPDVERFRLEVHHLDRYLDLIERIRCADTDRLPVEEAHLRDVNRLLDRCQRILNKLLESIRRTTLGTDGSNEPWDLNAPTYSLPRVYISFFTRTLQMASTTFNLVYHWKHPMPRDSLIPEWGHLAKAIQGLRESVTQRRRFSEQEECVEERGLLRDVEDCMRSAEESLLMTRPQENGESTMVRFPLPPNGPLRLPVRHGGSSVVSSQHDSRTDEQASDDSDGESIADPEPDVDVAFTSEAYAFIIDHLGRELERDTSNKDYLRAERTYKIMEKRYIDRETNLGISFDNRSELREKLAEIYLFQKQYRKAKRVLVPLVRETPLHADRKWRLYLLLAHARCGLRQLDKAESLARGSLTGRHNLYGKDDLLTQQSAKLVISIYEAQDDNATAMALRGYYCPQTIPPPPPKSALRLTSNPPRQVESSNSSQSSHRPTVPDYRPPQEGEEETPPQSNNRVRWAPDVWVNDSGINARTKTGRTQLIDTIYTGDEEYVKMVLGRNPSVEAPCVDLVNPLMHAVMYGHKGIVQALLDHGARVDATTSGWTALHKATESGDLAIMQVLLAHGADIEAQAPFEYHAPVTDKARWRAIDQDRPDPTTATVSDEKEHSWTPLLRAAYKGDEAAVRLLLDRDASIHARSPTGGTALLHACETLHFATIDLLLMRGSDIHAHDQYGWRPLHRAFVKRSPDSLAVLQRLVDQGCDVNAKCNYRKTPLHNAVEKSDSLAVSFLLNNGADIEARDMAERTPLHTAIESRLESMVRLLLSLGADATAMNRDKDDALAAANHADRKSPEIISLLKQYKQRMKSENSIKSPNGKGAGNRKGSVGGDDGAIGSPKKDKPAWLLGLKKPR